MIATLSSKEIKDILLEKVKIDAATEIYGDFIKSETDIENGKMIRNKIVSEKNGLVHIKGEPKYAKLYIRARRKRAGGDLVGMSTVPEAIALNHMGVAVAGISLVTNYAAGITNSPLSHEEVTETAAEARTRFTAVLDALGIEGWTDLSPQLAPLVTSFSKLTQPRPDSPNCPDHWLSAQPQHSQPLHSGLPLATCIVRLWVGRWEWN